MALNNCSKKYICHLILFAILLPALFGCELSYTNVEHRRGKKALEKQQYNAAIEHFRKVILRDPTSQVALESAQEAARVAFFETKKFNDAIEFYKHLIVYSKAERERRDAQKQVANIYFEKMNDYKKSIEEYNKLLLLRNSSEEVVDYRFNLARAHFYLGDFSEALTEIEGALKISDNADRRFDLLMFLGNIYFNTKRAEQAIKVYEDILAKYPMRAEKDNVAMNIIVCYEDLEAFDKAIDGLEAMRSTYRDAEFIDLKIKRLKDRKANLPGSRGLRK
jgi:tetratricopeptide (TPR) repeat protein